MNNNDPFVKPKILFFIILFDFACACPRARLDIIFKNLMYILS
jgi:hypothetical protein